MTNDDKVNTFQSQLFLSMVQNASHVRDQNYFLTIAFDCRLFGFETAMIFNSESNGITKMYRNND